MATRILILAFLPHNTLNDALKPSMPKNSNLSYSDSSKPFFMNRIKFMNIHLSCYQQPI